MAPLTFCATPGCPQRVPSGHCAQHRRTQRHDEAQAQHAHGRALQWDRRWRRLSTWWRQHHPLCVCCAAAGRVEPATEVHHVQPHRGDLALRYDPANLQSLCHRCHSRKTLAEGGR